MPYCSTSGSLRVRMIPNSNNLQYNPKYRTSSTTSYLMSTELVHSTVV